ncbi:MAG: hypothetical protein DRP59_03925 [Spirochaetes bacterium]|nr:MAG: hypothetical protein DRP59_03925 [Spirochaetota bacterium]
MTKRDNLIRAIRFETPEYIPMEFVVNDACWHHFDNEQLYDLLEAHPHLFPDFKRPKGRYKPDYLVNALADKPYTDPWGCVWKTADNGITGSVHIHPLDTWDNFKDYRTPDPAVTDGTYSIDWDQIVQNVREKRAKGDPVTGGLPHGHTFLRIQDIRGYENFIFDMVDERKELLELLDMVENFNRGIIERWIKLEPDVITFPEDLGMQIGPMLSPDQFVKYIKPCYQRLMEPVRNNGILVHMHSDGDIRTLAEDLIDGGVDALNLQDLVNGIDWIADNLAGRVCVDLDIDRQDITFSGTPAQIDSLVREEVEKIGSKKGGLMMIYGLYPGVPIENASALMDAMEKYSYFYS